MVFGQAPPRVEDDEVYSQARMRTKPSDDSRARASERMRLTHVPHRLGPLAPAALLRQQVHARRARAEALPQDRYGSSAQGEGSLTVRVPSAWEPHSTAGGHFLLVMRQ